MKCYNTQKLFTNGALFSLRIFLVLATIAFSFVFDNYYPIMD